MNIRHYYPNTDGLAGLRTRLGYTQQQLADQLNISRSLVAMVENKKRSMPADMLIKMASLEIQLAGNKMQQQTVLPHPAELEFSMPDIHSPSLYERALKGRLQSRKLSAKLERMTGQYQETRKYLELLTLLLENKEANEDSISWWKASERSCIKKLEKCSLREQALLRNKIALVNAERQLSKSIQQHFGIKTGFPEDDNNSNAAAY
ncbi:hypothetical protein BH11BAC4_BH11BAC4_06670 [soil metagenome]